MDLLTIVLAGLVILAVVTLVDLRLGQRRIGPALRKSLSPLNRSRWYPYRSGIRIAPGRTENIWLQASGPDHRPAMSLNGYWDVVNMTGEQVHFTGASILKPLVEAEAVLVRCPQTGSLGNTAIDAGSISELVAYFWLHPAVCGPGNDFTTAIVFRDQFGNEHAVEDVIFRYSSGGAD